MGAFANNANPVKISAGPDRGALAVFHVGDGITKGSLRRCSNGTTPPMISSPAMSARHAFAEGPAAQNSTKACKPQKHAPISLSKSISTPYRNGSSGAWGSVRQSCVGEDPKRGPPWSGCPHFSNAAPLILANATTLILHAGCPGSQGNGLNLAVAPHWTGPYRPLLGTDSAGHNKWYTPSIDTHAFNSNGCTDPFLYMDPRGRYHALFHCHWQGDDSGDEGGHAFSMVQQSCSPVLCSNALPSLPLSCALSLTFWGCVRVSADWQDGITWTTSAVRPFDESVLLNDGTNITYNMRQRPHLVLRNDGVKGVSPSGSPMALVTGLKLFNDDPNGQLPWMKWCSKSMEYGCDRTITHLQAIR